jgi:sugar phosphate isomerase/epimerase
MNDQSIYVSSGAFKARSVSEIIALALEAGLHRIELGSGTTWADNILGVVRSTSGKPMSFLVHNYFPPHRNPFVLNLAATDAHSLALSQEHCRFAIDLTRELGAPFFSVHSGFAFAASPEQLGRDLTKTPRVSLDEAHQIFVRNLRELCSYAAAKGVEVLIENNVIAPFNLINGQNKLGLCASAEDLLQTYTAVGSSNLGFLIDVGHLKVTATALRFDKHAFLDKVAPHVRAFHLSENDGMTDQNHSFDEQVWFLARLADFPRATMILEAYHLEIDEILNDCRVIERACGRIRAI